MSDLTAAAMSWLAAHHGVITVADLRRCGVGRPTREPLVRLGVLEPVHKGVFVTALERGSLAQRSVALCAAHPHGFVTGPTGGVLLGLRRMPVHLALHLSIRHGARVDPVAGVRFRQTTAIVAADLAAIERRRGHPRRPGSGRFRRAIETLDDSAPHDSHPEVELAEALRARGVPVDAQVAVLRPGGRTARIDLAVRAARWGVELDIHPEHHTVDGAARDAQRRRDLPIGGLVRPRWARNPRMRGSPRMARCQIVGTSV